MDVPQLRAWAKITAGGEDVDELLERVLTAVVAHATRTLAAPAVDDEDGIVLWEQALYMQAARIWKRRDTPEGVINWGPDGVVRVNRFDADVVELLEPFRKFVIG